MKKIVGFMAAIVSAASFAAQNDTLITFSSVGPDRYADGTTVKDGECYALVWTKTGTSFPGFLADGSVAGADSRLLIVAPRASGGCCPPTLFQIGAKDAGTLSGGAYGVYLLDTRDASGRPLGVKREPETGRRVPRAVNGFGEIADATTELSTRMTSTSASVRARTVARAAKTAAVPADAPQPEIKSMKVENGKVYVTVAKTVPYLQYNVSRGVTPEKVGANASDVNVATPQQGVESGEVTIELPAEGSSGFFRVNRN